MCISSVPNSFLGYHIKWYDYDEENRVATNIIEAHKVSWQGGAFLGKLKTKYRDSTRAANIST